MVYINGNYELINNIDDVVNICRKYISDEFADKVQEIYKDIEDKKDCIDEAYRQLKEAKEYIEAAMLNLEDV